MKRTAEDELVVWKNGADRRPLIVRGARQVGKTYLVEAFGKEHFPSVLTVNLEQKEDLHSLFTRMEAGRIVQELSLYFVPVEVRAGASGSLKSLQVFLAEKKRDFAVRLNMDKPSIGSFTAAIGGRGGTRDLRYTLLSLPLYLAGQLDRLLREYLGRT